jgi:nucleotide-binding universal stress UspA family protein
MSSASSYHTIVVGTDGSETSLRAVDHAARLAGSSGALLVIVTGYQPWSGEEVKAASLALKDDAYLVHGSAPAETLLADAASRARLSGAPTVETRALRGEPVSVLHQVVAETHADLLVVGDVGLNTWSGRLFGSIPARTARQSSIDVLLAHTS